MLSSSRNPVSVSDGGNLEYKIAEIAERVKNQGRKRQILAGVLRRLKRGLELPTDGEHMGDLKLVIPTERDSLFNCVVVGVDGGVLGKALHDFDLILLRAVAVIFRYEGGILFEAKYHPSEVPPPKLMSINEPLDSHELELLVGFHRQLAELKRASEAVKERDVDALLLDGSVVPQYTDHGSSPATAQLYKELINSFKDLYRTCTKKEILLMGIVKDSRSTRLIKIFQKKILPVLKESSALSAKEISLFEDNKGVLLNSRDISFLDHLLDPKERSFVFRYAEAPGNLLKDLGNWRNKVYVFYIRPVPYDCSLRVEFINGGENAREIVDQAPALVQALSANHDSYALPSVLIEADACARLAQEEISIIRDNIADRLNPAFFFNPRRERRPF